MLFNIKQTDLETRLVDGTSSNEGRVEVYYNGAWGTVCDDLWDDTDAGVVCSSLSLGSTGTAVSYAGFGQGTGDIILDNVQCTGSETNIASCANNGLGVHNCAHREDAGVRCSSGGGECPNTYLNLNFVSDKCHVQRRFDLLLLLLETSESWSILISCVKMQECKFPPQNNSKK